MVNTDDLSQLIRYENWLIRRIASGDTEMVQSVLVGHGFNKDVIEYVEKRKKLEQKTVRLIKYSVNNVLNDIELEEI